MTPFVRLLLVLNFAVFILQTAAHRSGSMVVEYYGAFIPQLILAHPWSLVTYMFLHGGFAHIAFNMLSLWFFGPRVEDRMGSGRFMFMYFLSGICGALLQMVTQQGGSMVGASAGVFGVMLCYARYWPNYVIHIWGLIPVTARAMVVVSTAIALFYGIGGGGNIAHFAHLGGYAGAYLYLRWLERGRHEFKQKVERVAPTTQKRIEDWQRIDLKAIHSVNRDEVKRLIEKISADGIGALTPQERLFLSNFVPSESVGSG
jgi:rhomboid family protein